MKTWHIALIGAVGGSLIGIAIYIVADPSSGGSFFYPIDRSSIILGRFFCPDDSHAGLVFFFPLLVLYFALIGISVALAARFLRKKLLA